jgi:hypothetical protein
MKKPKIEVSKEVRDYLTTIGKKGGTTGKGTEKSKAKTRAATAARMARRADRAEQTTAPGAKT